MITEDNKLDEATTVNYSTSSLDGSVAQENPEIHTKGY